MWKSLHDIDPRDEINSEEMVTLARAFSEQLLACLDECARGRKGLFSEYVDDDGESAVWPEAARLRESGCRAAGRSSRNWSSATPSATSSSTCAPFTARATQANANWRARFLSASNEAK